MDVEFMRPDVHMITTRFDEQWGMCPHCDEAWRRHPTTLLQFVQGGKTYMNAAKRIKNERNDEEGTYTFHLLRRPQLREAMAMTDESKQNRWARPCRPRNLMSLWLLWSSGTAL